jgi:DNA-binding NarL/FixJ family response regulator
MPTLPDCSLQRGIVEAGCNIKFKTVDEVTKSRIRVLVVEDHPIVADGIVAILAKANDMVVAGRATNGVEAIELIKEHQLDIVLLDLRMPVIDGIGVASWINDSGSTARVVFLTMFHSEEDVSAAIRAGADAYLRKDTPAAEILKTIRRVHRRKERISHDRAREVAPSANLNSLELEILSLIVQGDDNRTIGAKLGLRTDAIKYHLRGLFSKLGVSKRAAAARRGIELNVG